MEDYLVLHGLETALSKSERGRVSFIKLSPIFAITPDAGNWCVEDKINISHQSIGICVGCKQQVYVFQVAGKEEVGLVDHTVVRCTGDGCNAIIRLPGIIRTFGELIEACGWEERRRERKRELLRLLENQLEISEEELVH